MVLHPYVRMSSPAVKVERQSCADIISAGHDYCICCARQLDIWNGATRPFPSGLAHDDDDVYIMYMYTLW